ncbi:MAG: glutamate 5-kinase [Verrucomicrobiales bacterium]|jgi:glutamate 5-kinase|nr:glutamate 5-kinase [Verrucomicrobiales bacterium]
MNKSHSLWVIKLGSNLLTSRSGVNRALIQDLARQIDALRRAGCAVIMVSSGAISAGMAVMGLSKRPADRQGLQACATIGQPKLMEAYSKAFKKFGMHAAQILVTSWDLDSRKVCVNLQATLARLVALGNAVPIFNENDALSFEELEMLNRFGDNDQLSAHVSLLVKARRLVILSDIPGLNTRPDGTGALVRRVREVDAEILSYAGQSRSERSVGGMISKLETAKRMLAAKIPMVIASGREKDILLKIHQNQTVGTWFKA